VLPDTPAARKAGRRGGLLPTGAAHGPESPRRPSQSGGHGRDLHGRPAVGHCTTARLDGDIEGGGWPGSARYPRSPTG